MAGMRMIRTARIILAGLLHVLAAKIDVHETYFVDMDIDELDGYYDAMQARIYELDQHARMN